MFQIEVYNKAGSKVADDYINPITVCSLVKNVGENVVYGRLNNGQAFTIMADDLDKLITAIDEATGGGGGGGGGHDPAKLPFLPVDGPAGQPTPGYGDGSLAQVNANLKYIWENTKEAKKLTPEELKGDK